MEKPFPAYRGDEPYIFVSYAHADEDLVYSEIQWLHEQGFNIWYDEGISPGTLWRDELAENIDGSHLFLFVVTPQSVNSEHCQREVNYAVDHHKAVLLVHLERTDLPSGLDLTLSTIQAIFRYELSDHEYHKKLISGASAHIQRGVASTPAVPKVERTSPLHVGWLKYGAGVAVLASFVAGWTLWLKEAENAIGSRALGSPPYVVILMDTPAAKGVYDPETLLRSETNADDLTNLLADLPLVLHKEALGSDWNRDQQVLGQQPTLIMIHRSAFFHSMNAEFDFGYRGDPAHQPKLWDLLYRIADNKLVAFLGYVGKSNPRTRFLIYSRGTGGGWPEESYRTRWVLDAEHRFPFLEQRVFTMVVPGGVGGASFQAPDAAKLAREKVSAILELDSDP